MRAICPQGDIFQNISTLAQTIVEISEHRAEITWHHTPSWFINPNPRIVGSR